MLERYPKPIRYALVTIAIFLPFALIAVLVKYNTPQDIVLIPATELRVSEVKDNKPINSRLLNAAQGDSILGWLRDNQSGWKQQFGDPTAGVLAVSISHKQARASVLHLMPGFAVFETVDEVHFRKLTESQYQGLLATLGYQ